MRRWLSPLIGAALLTLVVVQVGPEPIAQGVRSLEWQTVALALIVVAMTTACCAVRWQRIAGRLGAPLGMGDAVRAVYQAQFVNLALPGGVLGDLHRGYSHGRASSSVGLGLRSVVWERTAGQVVQVSATVLLVLLLKLPTGIRRPSGGLVAVGVLAAVLLVVAACSRRLVPLGRLLFADLRRLLSLRVWPIVVATSLLATAGHLVVFIAAARATGVTASLGTLAGLGLTVLLAASIPTSLAGWGPREAVAAWSFTHVGLSAAEGVAATTAYGVLALLATLPGAFLLMRRPHRHAQIREVAHG